MFTACRGVAILAEPAVLTAERSSSPARPRPQPPTRTLGNLHDTTDAAGSGAAPGSAFWRDRFTSPWLSDNQCPLNSPAKLLRRQLIAIVEVQMEPKIPFKTPQRIATGRHEIGGIDISKLNCDNSLI